jgi:hypothetical protein
MFEFSDFSNQTRSNTASSIDFTQDSIFFAAQRSKIANIVAVAVKTIQMQQFISSSITEVRSQKAALTDFIKK